jgi:hypothetical protein
VAIQLRGATSAGNGSGTASNVTIPITGWTGADPQAGDVLFVVVRAGTASLTFTQTSGSTWTIQNQGTIQSYSYMFASRVMQAGDTAPTFDWVTAGRYCWAALALYSDIGGALSTDTWAAEVNSGAAVNSVTPGAATAAGAGEASVILTCARATGNSASWASYTYTPPTGWTAPAGGVIGDGTSTLNMRLGAAVYQLGVSGTVTPGSESLTDNVSDTFTFSTEHALVSEAGAAGPASVPYSFPQMRTELVPGGGGGRIIQR